MNKTIGSLILMAGIAGLAGCAGDLFRSQGDVVRDFIFSDDSTIVVTTASADLITLRGNGGTWRVATKGKQTVDGEQVGFFGLSEGQASSLWALGSVPIDATVALSYLPSGVFRNEVGSLRFERLRSTGAVDPSRPVELLSVADADPYALYSDGRIFRIDATGPDLWVLAGFGTHNNTGTASSGVYCGGAFFVADDVNARRGRDVWVSKDGAQTWKTTLRTTDSNGVTFACQQSGDVWLVENSGGSVYYFSRGREEWQRIADVSGVLTVLSAAAGAAAEVYFAGQGLGGPATVARVDLVGAIDVFTEPPGDSATSIRVDRNGIPWVAATGLHRWQPEERLWAQVWP